MATATNISVSNINPATTTWFTASIGDTIRLCRPAGYPPWPTDNAPTNIDSTEYERVGFKLLEPYCGKFIDITNPNDTCVLYKHEKSGKQIIAYYAGGAIVPITFYAIVQGILVHDHASVYMGGPAYATYYADTPAEE
jgi:hypothetical protein